LYAAVTRNFDPRLRIQEALDALIIGGGSAGLATAKDLGAGTLAPVNADSGGAPAGYAWSGKSFVAVCSAPADEPMALDGDDVIDLVLGTSGAAA